MFLINICADLINIFQINSYELNDKNLYLLYLLLLLLIESRSINEEFYKKFNTVYLQFTYSLLVIYLLNFFRNF